MADEQKKQQDLEFLTGMRNDLEGLKKLYDDKVADQCSESGDLRKLVDSYPEKLQDIEKRITQLLAEKEPLESNTKKKLRADLDSMKQRVGTLGERLAEALDAEWPPPPWWAWIPFAVGIGLIIWIFSVYLNLHTGRPLHAFLKGIDVEHRVDLATKMSAIRTRAVVFDALPARAEGEEAEKNEMVHSLKIAMSTDLEAANTTFKEAGFSESIAVIFQEHYDRIKEELDEETPSGKIILIHADQIYERVLNQEEPFFWDKGVGRYVEVFFASFFGIMAFTLYNWWKQMRKPLRGWWLGWYVAKIIGTLIMSFAVIAILSQVNFTTPQSLKDQTALGLGTASMDIVVAFSIITGYFSHLAIDFLEAYATGIFKGLTTGQSS